MLSFEKSYIEQITHTGFPISNFIQSEKKYKSQFGGGELAATATGGTSRFDNLVIPIGFDSHTNYFNTQPQPMIHTTQTIGGGTGISLPISDDLFDKLFLQVAQTPKFSHKITLKKRHNIKA